MIIRRIICGVLFCWSFVLFEILLVTLSHQVAKTNAEAEEAKRKAEEEEWGHFGSWDFGILVIDC